MANLISQQARQGAEFIFTKAAKANLLLDSSDAFSIQMLPNAKVQDFPEKTLIVLTISSFLFRVLTIFHISENAATKAYFTQGSSEKTLIDSVSELGNLCCGAMNRELHQQVSHLGMSTPYVLKRQCMDFLKELRPDHVVGFEISINDTVHMHATLCLCAYAPIHFPVDMSAVEEETGALELV